MKDLIIAIDPDADKSGLAYYNVRNKSITVYSLTFFEIFTMLKAFKEVDEVIIEAGYLVKKSNFHSVKGARNSRSVGEKIAEKSGRNGQVSRLLSEMCDHLGCKHYESYPLKKVWRGPEGKITHEELMKLLQGSGIDLVRANGKAAKKTNQEERDAVLLALMK